MDIANTDNPHNRYRGVAVVARAVPYRQSSDVAAFLTMAEAGEL